MRIFFVGGANRRGAVSAPGPAARYEKVQTHVAARVPHWSMDVWEIGRQTRDRLMTRRHARYSPRCSSLTSRTWYGENYGVLPRDNTTNLWCRATGVSRLPRHTGPSAWAMPPTPRAECRADSASGPDDESSRP